jgi:transcriptional regulator with XRE-family HTH domain
MKKRARETLGEHVRRLRVEQAMTLRALARRVGVSAPFLSDLEHDRRRPSEATLKLIANALDAPLSKLAAHSVGRDALAIINRDPELVELLRAVMSDRCCRHLVLDAAGILPKSGRGG